VNLVYCTPVLFTGTGTAEFTVSGFAYASESQLVQQHSWSDSSPGGIIHHAPISNLQSAIRLQSFSAPTIHVPSLAPTMNHAMMHEPVTHEFQKSAPPFNSSILYL
jgi:hypothetical protein